MIYKLDNKPLSDFGAYPGRIYQNYALEGMFDLPKRIGKTEHDWGTSIEPFVEAEDIELDGRTLVLCAVMKLERLDAFKNACIACKCLSANTATFDVVCKDEIKVEKIGPYCMVKVRFWQYKFELKPITVIPSLSGYFRIDNYNLIKDLGIYVRQSNNLLDAPKRIEVNTTEFYKITKYRGTKIIEFQCALKGKTFEEQYNRMNEFHSILMAPGMRNITIRNKALSLYFKDGMSVTAPYEHFLQFTLKGICI